MTSDLDSAVLEPPLAAAPAFDLVASTAEIRDTARRDAGAALALLNAAAAKQALLSLDVPPRIRAASVSGWSRPDRSEALPSRASGLVVLRDGGRTSVVGSQSFGATGADGPLLAFARDRGGDAHLVELQPGPHLHQDEPIFGRAGFRQRWIEAASPVAGVLIASIPAARVQPILVETARGEELLHAALDLGILEGFRAAADVHVTTRTRPWQGQSLAKATDDPHLVRRTGEFVATIHAAAGLFEEAITAVRAEAADASVAVATARAFFLSAGRRVISGTIELLGASATSDRYGFDLFWRDFTAHAVANPPFWPSEEIGRRLIRSAKDESLK